MITVTIKASIQYKRPTDYSKISWGGYLSSDQVAVRTKAKDAVRQSIHHLQSLMDTESVLEESLIVADKAYEALEVL